MSGSGRPKRDHLGGRPRHPPGRPGGTGRPLRRGSPTPSLAKMLDTCTLAVLVLMNKARADLAVGPAGRHQLAAPRAHAGSARPAPRPPYVGAVRQPGPLGQRGQPLDQQPGSQLARRSPAASASTARASARPAAATRCWASRSPAYGRRWARRAQTRRALSTRPASRQPCRPARRRSPAARPAGSPTRRGAAERRPHPRRRGRPRRRRLDPTPAPPPPPPAAPAAPSRVE